MHDDIIRYHLDGQIDDGNVIQSRDRMIEFLKSQMADDKVSICLDIDPQFTLDYDVASETYQFELTVYGVYTGDRSAKTAGISGGKLLVR